NYKNAYLHDKVTREGTTKTVVRLSEEATFLNKADIMLFLEHVPEGHSLCIDARRSRFIHPDIYEIIEEFKKTAKFKGIELELLGLQPDACPARADATEADGVLAEPARGSSLRESTTCSAASDDGADRRASWRLRTILVTWSPPPVVLRAKATAQVAS